MFQLGKLLLESREIERAISDLLNAVKQGGKETVLNLLGEAYQANGQNHEVEQLHATSLQASPLQILSHLAVATRPAKM